MALTLFGKPASRDSVIDRDSTSSFRESGSYRDSLREKITGPQPVDVSILIQVQSLGYHLLSYMQLAEI